MVLRCVLRRSLRTRLFVCLTVPWSTGVNARDHSWGSSLIGLISTALYFTSSGAFNWISMKRSMEISVSSVLLSAINFQLKMSWVLRVKYDYSMSIILKFTRGVRYTLILHTIQPTHFYVISSPKTLDRKVHCVGWVQYRAPFGFELSDSIPNQYFK